MRDLLRTAIEPEDPKTLEKEDTNCRRFFSVSILTVAKKVLGINFSKNPSKFYTLFLI
jgi:hypothetical protein